ncbi:hypothetical protein HYQ46_006259 [Verticillium longisporum]|nr:hypothetical protein HYQ46_006259 [Verticillium longisporum]
MAPPQADRQESAPHRLEAPRHFALGTADVVALGDGVRRALLAALPTKALQHDIDRALARHRVLEISLHDVALDIKAAHVPVVRFLEVNLGAVLAVAASVGTAERAPLSTVGVVAVVVLAARTAEAPAARACILLERRLGVLEHAHGFLPGVVTLDVLAVGLLFAVVDGIQITFARSRARVGAPTRTFGAELLAAARAGAVVILEASVTLIAGPCAIGRSVVVAAGGYVGVVVFCLVALRNILDAGAAPALLKERNAFEVDAKSLLVMGRVIFADIGVGRVLERDEAMP